VVVEWVDLRVEIVETWVVGLLFAVVAWFVGSVVVPSEASLVDSFGLFVGLAELAVGSYLALLGKAGPWSFVAVLVVEIGYTEAVVIVLDALGRIAAAEAETVVAASGFGDIRLALEVGQEDTLLELE
jgi:hypothetical protein